MKFSDGEWTVMNAVWRGSPASARDVLERTADETGWAYSTVKTMLSRLVEKGALKVRKRANTSLYEPCVTRGRARRAALRSLLDNAFEGAFGPMVHHMLTEERLSKRDREALARMLREMDGSSGKGK